MARRAKRSVSFTKRDEAQLGILVLIGLGWAALYAMRNILIFLIPLALLAVGVAIYFELKRRKMLSSSIDAAVEPHIGQLRIRREQLLTPDGYGGFRTERWEKELKYFSDTVLAPQLAELHRPKRDTPLHILAANCINSALPPVGASVSQTMSSADFEIRCADIVRGHGWEASLTKGSGDQGVDVIARWGSIKVVLQCKLYTKPVGNAAVQEIAAGRAHERAQFAAVVSNQEYTNAARELASTNGVALLHFEELGAYLDRLSAS